MKRTIFLMLAVLLSALSASAYAFKVDGIAYNKNGDGKSVYVAYGGDYTGPVTIPERVTYDGATYSVTTIGDYAFSDCTGLTSVTIPSSVNSIGEEAFRGCTGLTSVTIPTSVTEIGYSAFGGTPWYNNQPDGVVYIGKVAYEFKGEMASGTAINIKEGTVSISGYAFYGCTGLTSVTIPNSITKIRDDTFKGCTGLTSITIPNSVTEIGWSAFKGCTGLPSVTIPNSVTEIGWSAFRGCAGLTSVTIPNSVTEIGWSAFEGCTALTSVTFNATNCKSPDRTYEAWFQDCPLTSLVIGNDVKSIPSCLAYYQTRLTTVTIPNSVISIGWYAFVGCTGLTSVTIPNSVTEIGYSAFYGCTGLTSVTIPNSITKIRDDTFKGCTGLTSITIPNSVTTIGGSAFSGCTGLPSVTIPNSVTTIGGSAFSGCTGLKKIYSLNPVPPVIYWDTFVAYDVDLFVPKGCVPKYKNAEYWRLFKFIGEIEEEGGIDDVIGADSKIKYDGGTITISVPSEIAVYSIDGKLVATANGVSLDTESLTHGTYVVRAADAHGNVQTLKFIK